MKSNKLQIPLLQKPNGTAYTSEKKSKKSDNLVIQHPSAMHFQRPPRDYWNRANQSTIIINKHHKQGSHKTPIIEWTIKYKNDSKYGNISNTVIKLMQKNSKKVKLFNIPETFQKLTTFQKTGQH